MNVRRVWFGLGLLGLAMAGCVNSPGGAAFSAPHTSNGTFYGINWQGNGGQIQILTSVREVEGNVALCASFATSGGEIRDLTRQALATLRVAVNGELVTRSLAYAARVSSRSALTRDPANCIISAVAWDEGFEDASFEFLPVTTDFFYRD